MLARFPKAISLVCLLVAGIHNHSVEAQQQPRSSVQLPTFRVFGVNTTVWVPVGGRTHLGSIKRYAAGSTSRGVPLVGNIPGAGRLFNNRAMGVESSASTSSVQVEVHDLEAMDKALLAEARKSKTKYGAEKSPNKVTPTASPTYARKSATQRLADFITKNMGRSTR